MSSEDLTPRKVRRRSYTGDPDSAIFNMHYGPSHFGSTDLVPINQDILAYVFITKPNCNMSKQNIVKVRQLQYLLDEDPNSQACAIKCLMSTYHYWDEARDGVRSNAVNDHYPFIPFLSSSLESLSGWPDEVMEFFESEEGWAKEVMAYPDGKPESNSSFDLQFTFNSKEGDPHGAFFTAMYQYMGNVATGKIVPLPVSENEFEVDTMQNVYVVLTDRSKKYVQKIACLKLGGMWQGTNNGSYFNFEKGSTIQQGARQISIPMRCVGFMYNDPAIIERFNQTVANFHSGIRNLVYLNDPNRMVKINTSVKEFFQNRGYPLINPSTSELEWWIEKEVYIDILTSTNATYDPLGLVGVNND